MSQNKILGSHTHSGYSGSAPGTLPLAVSTSAVLPGAKCITEGVRNRTCQESAAQLATRVALSIAHSTPRICSSYVLELNPNPDGRHIHGGAAASKVRLIEPGPADRKI